MEQAKHEQLERLLHIMKCLRDPIAGCDWDKQQTFSSIAPYTIEEAYEVADAIENGTMDDVLDELGDLLFQVVFYAQMAKEKQLFEFEDIARTISDKMYERHPHVFNKGQPTTDTWDSIKQRQKSSKSPSSDHSILAGVERNTSPLVRAQKLQKKCAKVGFDWSSVPPVIDKVLEEVDEIKQELNRENNQPAMEEEIGDLLFAVTNLARHCGVNSETALRKANNKFENRFRQVEQSIVSQGQTLDGASMEQMEEAWKKVKVGEKR